MRAHYSFDQFQADVVDVLSQHHAVGAPSKEEANSIVAACEKTLHYHYQLGTPAGRTCPIIMGEYFEGNR